VSPTPPPPAPGRASAAPLATEASFFATVRALQATAVAAGAVPVGHQGPAGREAVWLRPALDLAFGPTEVADVQKDAETGRYEVTTRFLGLYGTNSPLPAWCTELLLHDDPEGRLRSFLDVFNHRLLSLFYRAFAKYRHEMLWDGRARDPITARLRILARLDADGDDVGLLRHFGLWRRQPLSEASLEALLQVELQVPVEVWSGVRRWLSIPVEQRAHLGEPTCTLGGTAPLGDALEAVTTTFGVRVGPLPRETYLAFLPGGPRRAQLERLLDRCAVASLDALIEVAIDPAAITPCTLGDPRGQLGATSWLGPDAAGAAGAAAALGATSSRLLYSPNSSNSAAQVA
jgi:type VI secretion system protein ImpH